MSNASRVHIGRDGPVGLLLAGGRGSRFDSSGHRDKLLANYGGEPVAVHAARNLAAACPKVFAVLPTGKPELLALLEAQGCETFITEVTRLGMGHSIAHGVARILERCKPSVLVIALGDMPAIKPQTIRLLVDAASVSPEAIVAPTHLGRRGHPVVFGASHLPSLCELTGDRGAFSLLERHRPTLIAVEDPGVLQDIDTPDDLGADAAHGSMDRRRDTPDSHHG